MQATIDDRRVGYDAAGSGVPLLLLHAFPLNRTMYAEQAEGLRDIARVIAFDAPGVSRSEPGPLSIDGLADLAVGLLDALQIPRAVVGGVSMGGYVALSFARRHPDRLLGLILANTRAAADSEEARKGRAETAQVARKQGPGAIAEQMLPKVLGPTALKRNRKLVSRVRAMIEGVPGEVIADLLAALAGRADSTPSLGAISVPTLVIASEDDTVTPAAEARQWAQEIPESRYVEIPGVGHLSNLEAPTEFNQAIRTFLETAILFHDGSVAAAR
ncbi:MAG: alpha/beta fold hydrolase [Acidobacteria bacterium]|nr:alpha/beta fold hydrolase [Acidobacteriota bacterium]